MSKNNDKSRRTPPPYRPSFVTPPPSNRNLYGASSSQGNNAESNATEVLSNDEDLPSTPPLSPYNDAGVAESATPSGPRLKKTAEPGYRGNPVFFNEHYKWWRRNLRENGSYTNVPSNECGETVAWNDPRRNARRVTAPVESDRANWSSATPLSRRNVMARAVASEVPEGPNALAAPAALFSPAASHASILSLTPKRKRNNMNRANSHQNHNSNSNANSNKNRGKESRKGGAWRSMKRKRLHKKTRVRSSNRGRFFSKRK